MATPAWLRNQFSDIEYCFMDLKLAEGIQTEYKTEGLLRLANLRDALINELITPEKRDDGSPIMTDAQRNKLWDTCHRYGVNFNENDYFIDRQSGYAEGWIGGRAHARGYGDMKPTIYMGVSPEGDGNT